MYNSTSCHISQWPTSGKRQILIPYNSEIVQLILKKLDVYNYLQHAKKFDYNLAM